MAGVCEAMPVGDPHLEVGGKVARWWDGRHGPHGRRKVGWSLRWGHTPSN